jgi:hypothetical protein
MHIPNFSNTVQAIWVVRKTLFLCMCGVVATSIWDVAEFWSTHVSVWWPHLKSVNATQAAHMWGEIKVFLFGVIKDWMWIGTIWVVRALVWHWPVPNACYDTWSDEADLPPRVAHWMSQEMLWSRSIKAWQLCMIEELARKEVKGYERLSKHQGKLKIWKRAQKESLEG